MIIIHDNSVSFGKQLDINRVFVFFGQIIIFFNIIILLFLLIVVQYKNQ